MQRPTAIQTELNQIRTVEDLVQVFESIASMHIAKLRSRVVSSKDFFAELWQTYTGLRVNPRERLRREHAKNGRNVFVAITAEGKLSGDIDEQVVATMLDAHAKAQNTDIIVVGSRGARQLEAAGKKPVAIIPMPPGDTNVNVADLNHAINQYNQISVFYQTYDSLRVQRIARIELISAVRSLGEDVSDTGETVSSQDYIFEPSINEIADYMESVMMGVALIQIIMESKLAQHANRFNTMSRAKHRAHDMVGDFQLSYYRAKRASSDERIKEVLKSRLPRKALL